MAIPEPTGPLWAAVKAIHDPWPPDDEDVAANLGGAWGQGADVVLAGAGSTAGAGGTVLASWRDVAGDAFGTRVDEFTRTVNRVEPSMRELAARAEHYGRELTSAKTTITGTIAANETTYALLGNPLLGFLGPALQGAFATSVANDLQAMVEAKAAGLGGGPVAPAQPPPVPAPPPPPPEPNWFLGLLGDAERGLGDLAAGVGMAAGETSDNLVDGVGAVAGTALRTVGLEDAGNTVEGGLDQFGDAAAETWLAGGATVRNLAYDVAEVIDGTDRPRNIYISRERFPESAGHIDDAQGGTIWRGDSSTPGPAKPSVLTVDRAGASERRDQSTSVVPPLPGKDRDEYPPAVAKEGGTGSSVKYIDPSDNRGAGSSMGNQLNGRNKSIQRQLDGVGIDDQVAGLGRVADDDQFRIVTF
jgi:hypothetical protein